MIADIFNAPVFTREYGPVVACLGGAYRAIHALKKVSAGAEQVNFDDALGVDDRPGETPTKKPQKDAVSVSARSATTLRNKYA